MTEFRSILSPFRSRASLSASSKKRALEQAAELIAHDLPGLPERKLFDQLMTRERLGSTGLGEGVAIPHCRLEGIESITGAFLHLEDPIDFDADDGQPVDLIFVLIVPEDAEQAHLEVLKSLAGVFQSEANRKDLRGCRQDAALYQAIIEMFDTLNATHSAPRTSHTRPPSK